MSTSQVMICDVCGNLYPEPFEEKQDVANAIDAGWLVPLEVISEPESDGLPAYAVDPAGLVVCPRCQQDDRQRTGTEAGDRQAKRKA